MFGDWIQAITGSFFWEYRSILLQGLIVNLCVHLLAGVLPVEMGLVACLARPNLVHALLSAMALGLSSNGNFTWTDTRLLGEESRG